MNVESVAERQPERRPDHLCGKIPVQLAKEDLRDLSTINPSISSLHIAGEWLLILAAIYLCQRFWNPVLYVVTVAFIGARQHALLILMHDGTHYRLFRNRRLNDVVTEVLLAWPHLVAMRSYRQNHFAHHRHLNTDLDPDWARKRGTTEWAFPKNWTRLGLLLARDVSGFGAVSLIKLTASLSSGDTAASRGFVLARLGFYAAVVIAAICAGGLKLLVLYWLVPFATWLMLILRIRSIAEHFAINGRENVYAQIRTTKTCLLDRIFIAPKNVNYHIEHHFYPSVPFYRLPKLHQLLLEKSDFRSAAHVTRSYWGVLKECAEGAEGRRDAGASTPSVGVATGLGLEGTSR